MGDEMDHDIFYPTAEEVIAIHDDIIEEDEDATSGVLSEGSIDYALECIEHGHFGKKPETIHEKAVELLRLLSANHGFADGNKRTALNTTWTFYAINGYYFNYGEEIKAILKLFAVMERMVDKEEVTQYFGEITIPEDHPQAPSIIVRLTHLSKWREDFTARTKEFYQSTLGEEENEEDFDKYLDLVEEFGNLAEEFHEFKEENREDLPEEVVEYIEKVVEEKNETMSFIQDLAKITEEQGELPDEEVDRVREEYGLPSQEEARKQLEESLGEN